MKGSAECCYSSGCNEDVYRARQSVVRIIVIVINQHHHYRHCNHDFPYNDIGHYRTDCGKILSLSPQCLNTCIFFLCAMLLGLPTFGFLAGGGMREASFCSVCPIEAKFLVRSPVEARAGILLLTFGNTFRPSSQLVVKSYLNFQGSSKSVL